MQLLRRGLRYHLHPLVLVHPHCLFRPGEPMCDSRCVTRRSLGGTEAERTGWCLSEWVRASDGQLMRPSNPADRLQGGDPPLHWYYQTLSDSTNCARTRSIISDAAFLTHTRALEQGQGAPALCLQMQLDTQESQFSFYFPLIIQLDANTILKISFQSKRVMSGIQIVAGKGKLRKRTSYQSGDDVTKEEKKDRRSLQCWLSETD